MPTYQLAGQQTLAQVADMMHRYHERLEAAGVRVCCVFAHAAQDKNGEPKGPRSSLSAMAAMRSRRNTASISQRRSHRACCRGVARRRN
jgi:hypothetical protein